MRQLCLVCLGLPGGGGVKFSWLCTGCVDEEETTHQWLHLSLSLQAAKKHHISFLGMRWSYWGVCEEVLMKKLLFASSLLSEVRQCRQSLQPAWTDQGSGLVRVARLFSNIRIVEHSSLGNSLPETFLLFRGFHGFASCCKS